MASLTIFSILYLYSPRAEQDDYVLAPFDGQWYRGLVTASNDNGAVVAFIDYGKFYM